MEATLYFQVSLFTNAILEHNKGSNSVPFLFPKVCLYANLSMYVTSPMQIGTGRVHPCEFTGEQVALGDKLTWGRLDLFLLYQ